MCVNGGPKPVVSRYLNTPMTCLKEGVRVYACAITKHPLTHCHGAAVQPSILYFYPHGLLTFWTLARNTSDLSSRVPSPEGQHLVPQRAAAAAAHLGGKRIRRVSTGPTEGCRCREKRSLQEHNNVSCTLYKGTQPGLPRLSAMTTFLPSQYSGTWAFHAAQQGQEALIGGEPVMHAMPRAKAYR